MTWATLCPMVRLKTNEMRPITSYLSSNQDVAAAMAVSCSQDLTLATTLNFVLVDKTTSKVKNPATGLRWFSCVVVVVATNVVRIPSDESMSVSRTTLTASGKTRLQKDESKSSSNHPCCNVAQGKPFAKEARKEEKSCALDWATREYNEALLEVAIEEELTKMRLLLLAFAACAN